MKDAPSPRPWPYVLATVILFLGFTALWLLAGLVFGLGTCGEDSDITEEEYLRLCESGRIARNLVITGIAAVVTTVGLGAAAIRRHSARPVLILAGMLTLAAAATLSADEL